MWRTGFPLKIVICGFKPRESLELNGSAGFFELGLSLLSVFLLGLLQDSLRSAVDQSLGLSQTQGGDSADGLDDLDLLVANGGEDDVELVLLFLSRSSSARSGNGDSSRSGSLDVELLFETNSESSTRVISPKASSSSSLVYLAIMASFHSWRRFD